MMNLTPLCKRVPDHDDLVINLRHKCKKSFCVSGSFVWNYNSYFNAFNLANVLTTVSDWTNTVSSKEVSNYYPESVAVAVT